MYGFVNEKFVVVSQTDKLSLGVLIQVPKHVHGLELQ